MRPLRSRVIHKLLFTRLDIDVLLLLIMRPAKRPHRVREFGCVCVRACQYVDGRPNRYVPEKEQGAVRLLLEYVPEKEQGAVRLLLDVIWAQVVIRRWTSLWVCPRKGAGGSSAPFRHVLTARVSYFVCSFYRWPIDQDNCVILIILIT